MGPQPGEGELQEEQVMEEEEEEEEKEEEAGAEALSSGTHFPMWTVPLVLVRRTASPEHLDLSGLRSLAALVVVRLVVVPLQPRSPRRRWRVGWFGLIFCWT
jgi:hypothetical protein